MTYYLLKGVSDAPGGLNSFLKSMSGLEDVRVALDFNNKVLYYVAGNFPEGGATDYNREVYVYDLDTGAQKCRLSQVDQDYNNGVQGGFAFVTLGYNGLTYAVGVQTNQGWVFRLKRLEPDCTVTTIEDRTEADFGIGSNNTPLFGAVRIDTGALCVGYTYTDQSGNAYVKLACTDGYSVDGLPYPGYYSPRYGLGFVKSNYATFFQDLFTNYAVCLSTKEHTDATDLYCCGYGLRFSRGQNSEPSFTYVDVATCDSGSVTMTTIPGRDRPVSITEVNASRVSYSVLGGGKITVTVYGSVVYNAVVDLSQEVSVAAVYEGVDIGSPFTDIPYWVVFLGVGSPDPALEYAVVPSAYTGVLPL